MRTESFTTFATRYAQAMAGTRTYVTFGGTKAYTDGRRINLPAMPAGTMLTDWQTKVYSGYLDHEIAHLKYTNFKRIKIDQRKEPTKYGLFNIFEDIRIENQFIADYPPTKQYLDACTQQIEYDKREKDHPAKDTLGYQLLEAIYRECYETYRDADCSFEQKETIDQFPELAPIAEELKALPTLKSEEEACDLATRVYDLLPKNADYGAQPFDLNPGELGQLPILVIVKPGQGTEALDAAAILFIENNERTEAIEGLLEQIAEDNSARQSLPLPENYWSGDRVLPPVGTDHDRIFVPARKDHATYERTRAGAAAEITAAKRMLQIYLQSRTARAWEKGLPEGRLDTEALPTLFAGNANVFMQRRDRRMIDTAIQMMVDNSGSMDVHATRTAAIILAEALNGVPAARLAIAGFTTNNHHYQGRDGGRLNGIDLLSYKDFNEPYPSAADRLGAMNCTGYTPLGEAYGHGFARLMTRKESRRVLWVISDGEPCIDVANNDHNEYILMQRIHARCRANGITIIGMNIGRMSANMRKCCDAVRNVSSHRELPTALLETMKEIAR